MRLGGFLGLSRIATNWCLLAVLLAACSAGGPMFQEMSARVSAKQQLVIDLTDIAKNYIPIGNSEAQADAVLAANGFSVGQQYQDDELDERQVKSQYYKAYRRGTKLPASSFSKYVVALGFTGGKVDFVFAQAKGDAI
jgi:hypothetical protein